MTKQKLTAAERAKQVKENFQKQQEAKEAKARAELEKSEIRLKDAEVKRQSVTKKKVETLQASNSAVEDVNREANQARQKEEEEARLKLEKSLKKEDAAITRAAQAIDTKVAGSRNFKQKFEISSQASGVMSRSSSANNSTISSGSSGVTTNSSISSEVLESELIKNNKSDELSVDVDDDSVVNNTTTSQIQNEVIQEEKEDVQNLIVNSDAPIQQIREVEDDNLSESEQSVVNLTKPNIQENTQVEEEDEYDLNDFEEDDLISESEQPVVNLTEPNIQENTQVEEEYGLDDDNFEKYEEEVKESKPVVNQVINNPAPQNKLPQELLSPEISNKKSTAQQRAGASELRDAILRPIDEEDQKITADILNAATISLVDNAINIAQAQIIQVQKDLKNISPVITKEEDIDKILNPELLAQAEELGRQQMAATKFDSKSAKTAFDEIEKAFNQESDVEKVKTSINSARDGVQDTALQAYANITLGILESNEPDEDRDKGLERVKEEFQFLGNDDSRSKEENFDMMGSAYVNLLTDRDITNNVKQVIAISFQKAVTSQEYGKPREEEIDQEEENELPIKKLPLPSMPVIEEETNEELEEFEKDDVVIDQRINQEEEATELATTATQEETKKKELNLNLDGRGERTDWMKNYAKPGAKGLIALGLVSMAFPPVSMALAIPIAGLFLYATRDGKDLQKEEAEREAEFNKSVALFNSYEDFMPKKSENDIGKQQGDDEEKKITKIKEPEHPLDQYKGLPSNTGSLAGNVVNQEEQKLKENQQVLTTKKDEIERMQQQKQTQIPPLVEEKVNSPVTTPPKREVPRHKLEIDNRGKLEESFGVPDGEETETTKLHTEFDAETGFESKNLNSFLSEEAIEEMGKIDFDDVEGLEGSSSAKIPTSTSKVQSADKKSLIKSLII